MMTQGEKVRFILNSLTYPDHVSDVGNLVQVNRNVVLLVIPQPSMQMAYLWM